MGTLAEFLGGTGSSSEFGFEAVGTDCPVLAVWAQAIMQWTDQANCSLSGGALGLSNPSEQTFVSPTGVFSAIFAACDTRFVRVNGWVCYFGYTPPGRRGTGV
jgi:hypothetical protein